jgi:hypothetical protein
MPKFLKDNAIVLLDGGVESYLMALYGMAMPTLRKHRKAETKYAPIVGLYGASAELLVKACLVQAKGPAAMYQDGDISAGVFRFGSEVIEEFRKCIRDEESCVSYIWNDLDDHQEQKEQILHYIGKFKLLQAERACGLHAGIGSSRDVTVSAAEDIYRFIQLLSKSKKLKPYLKNIPAPEATIRDREAIIEDLTRRFRAAKDVNSKSVLLRNMYMVLPYIPETKPDWVDAFDRIAVAPPTEDDLSYLAKTLSDAHSIYLLKNRGGKDGVPVRVDPNDPDALPIAIQNIKRELTSTPDKFNNDVVTANSRLAEGRLDLPLDEFLVDLFALGLDGAGVITHDRQFLTAQETWPFVASAYSTNGTPRPCWFIIQRCNEIDRLISFLRKAGECGNGYFKRRLSDLLEALNAYKTSTATKIGARKGSEFQELRNFKGFTENLPEEKKKPFTSAFLKKNNPSEAMSAIIHEFVTEKMNAGDALSSALVLDELSPGDRKAAMALLALCNTVDNKHGVVSILRTNHLKGYTSIARKKMFFMDFLENGPAI